ncbi:hypothetical protein IGNATIUSPATJAC_91 [Mycobacterium phage IgnatiusPatJac]|nr:hypothetical protein IGNATIUSPATJAC_91 [Mycobacterium phage IgnatiusPatJac]
MNTTLITIPAAEVVVGDTIVAGAGTVLAPEDLVVRGIESDRTHVRINGLVDIHRRTNVRVAR